jgi:hypothetical protein
VTAAALIAAALLLTAVLWRIDTHLKAIAWNLKCIGEDARHRDD